MASGSGNAYPFAVGSSSSSSSSWGHPEVTHCSKWDPEVLQGSHGYKNCAHMPPLPVYSPVLPLHVLLFERLSCLVSDLYYIRSLLTPHLNQDLTQCSPPSTTGYTRIAF